MKTSNPYKASDTYKGPQGSIDAERAQASRKAKARYPDKPLTVSTKSKEAGKMKSRAYTPGGPAGS